MANIVVIHEVGDFDTWVSKKNRERLFEQVCKSYRLYRMGDQNKVAIVAEGVDLEKFQKMLDTPEAHAAMEEDTVRPPIDLFVQIEGAC